MFSFHGLELINNWWMILVVESKLEFIFQGKWQEPTSIYKMNNVNILKI